MPKMKFKGGPWDGVVLDVERVPDHVALHFLAESPTLAERVDFPADNPAEKKEIDQFLNAVDDQPIEIQRRRMAYNKGTTRGDGMFVFDYVGDQDPPYQTLMDGLEGADLEGE